MKYKSFLIKKNFLILIILFFIAGLLYKIFNNTNRKLDNTEVKIVTVVDNKVTKQYKIQERVCVVLPVLDDSMSPESETR